MQGIDRQKSIYTCECVKMLRCTFPPKEAFGQIFSVFIHCGFKLGYVSYQIIHPLIHEIVPGENCLSEVLSGLEKANSTSEAELLQ